MIVAKQKRKENIAEYLLYMWQVEDLIRANQFDIDSIRRTVIAQYDQPDDVKEEIAGWYEELIEMMRSEGVKEKGHIQLNKNVIIALTCICGCLNLRKKWFTGRPTIKRSLI